MSTGDLPHLETFAAAAEAGSFTAAARALGVSQAAISQRIQALERAVGAALFLRRAGRVELTDAGRRLHPLARQILALHREARAVASGRPPEAAGELVLAASSIPGEHLLPPLLAAFRARHPEVRVRATVLDSKAVCDLVARGKAHLGLVGDRPADRNLEPRAFATDTLVLVVPPRHPWRRRRWVTLDDLAGQPVLVREPGSGSRACLEHGLGRAGRGLRDLTVAAELGSNEAIKEAVVRGLGVAFLSEHAVGHELATGRLRAVPVQGLTLSRAMYVIRDRRRALPIPAQLFLDLVAAQPTS